MTTLADLTPEDRAQCKGMWCEDEGGKLCIYRADHMNDWLAICIYPDRVGVFAAKYDLVTLRPDLPRAWTPDGQPPAGEWEYAEYLSHYRGMTDVFFFSFDGEPTHRRWVGSWEEE